MNLFKHYFLAVSLFVFAGSGFAQDDQSTQSRTSSDGLYDVTVDSQLKPLQLGRMHAWTVIIKTPDDKPVTNASITVGGGMPVHNHGFPTNPEVTRTLDEGVYLIEGVKFSMRGPWVMFLEITANEQTDSVAFDIDM